MPWDDLIRAANKAETRAKIQESTHLDQQCPKEKRPLKMSFNTCNDQAEKTKAIPPTKDSLLTSDQSEVTKKVKKKARKEKKKKGVLRKTR